MSIAKQRASRANLSKLPEYSSWSNMSYRCLNPNNSNYYKYGGRGITVCQRWREKEGFSNFLKDMGKKPSPRHTLERIDNKKGYEPSNCRWATPREQAVNKRILNRNQTGYIGVSWVKSNKKYRVKLGVKGQMVHIGMYDDIEEAAIMYDCAVVQFHGFHATTNFI